MSRKIVIEVPDCCFDCQFNRNYGYPPHKNKPAVAYKRWCDLFTDIVIFDKEDKKWIPHDACKKATVLGG